MRLTYLFPAIGLLLPNTVHCRAQHEFLAVHEDVQALGGLKHLVALASTIASLVKDKDALPDNAQLEVDSDQGPAFNKGALLHDNDGPVIESDSSASLYSQNKDELLPDEPVNTLMPVVCPGVDADADANGYRGIVQQFALTAEGTRSRLGVDDQGGSSSAEPTLALGNSIAGGSGAGAGRSRSRKDPHASAPARVSGVNILEGLEALRQLASLVQSESMENTRYSAPETPLSPVFGKQLRSMSTAEPTLRQPHSRKRTQPLARPDILVRLEAMQRFSKLLKKLSTLTDESGSLPLRERIHHIISDPEIAPTVQWIFDNAGKVLTAEALSAVKGFIRSSSLVPDEHRSFALFTADLMGVVFDPKFALHYQKARASVEWLGVDLVPVLGSAYRAMHWIMAAFHPTYIQTLNGRVTLWREAFASPEMAGFVDVVTDPATLDGISSSMGRVKRALTGERIHRLRTVFDEWGVLDLNEDEYKAFGNVLGTKINAQLATAEGISEMEVFLDAMDALFRSQTIHALAVLMQKRAAVLTAGLSADLSSFFGEVSSAAATIPGGLGILHDFLDLIRPLLSSEPRGERLLARVWAVAGFIMDNVSSVQGSALADLKGVLDAGVRLMNPERIEELRVMIADLQRGETLSGSLGQVGVWGNASVGLEAFFGFSFGMSDIHTTSVLESDANSDTVSMLIQMLDARTVPGEVEKSREILELLNSTSSFLHSVIQVFESHSDSPELATEGHKDL
ncbi:hypothetical protein BDV10DRAFT_186953 [Aspergillus recurvatus]